MSADLFHESWYRIPPLLACPGKAFSTREKVIVKVVDDTDAMTGRLDGCRAGTGATAPATNCVSSSWEARTVVRPSSQLPTVLPVGP